MNSKQPSVSQVESSKPDTSVSYRRPATKEEADAKDLEKANKRLATVTNPDNRSALQAYVNKEALRVSPRTILARLDAILALAKHLGRRSWQDAREDDIIQCIVSHRFVKGQPKTERPGKPLSRSTQVQWASYLQHFYRKLLRTKDVPEIFQDLPFKKARDFRGHGTSLALSPQDVRGLFAGAASSRDRCIVGIALETGFRASELAALRLGSMGHRDGVYVLDLPRDAAGLKRGPRSVQVPIIGFRHLLKRWLAEHPRREDPQASLFVTLSPRSFGNPLDGSGIGDAVARCAKRAGLEGVHIHRLRHTCATFLVAKGVSEEMIRLQFGWEPGSRMLEYYSDSAAYYHQYMLQLHGLKPKKDELLDVHGAKACVLCGSAVRVDEAECGTCGALGAPELAKNQRTQKEHEVLKWVAEPAARNLGWKGQDDLAGATAFLERQYLEKTEKPPRGDAWMDWCWMAKAGLHEEGQE